MVPFKNVTMLFQPVVQDGLADGSLGNPRLSAASWTCNAFLEHMSPGEAFAHYAVVLENPAVLQIEVSDWALAQLKVSAVLGEPPANFPAAMANAQATVTGHLCGSGSFDGNVYAVRGRPVPYDDGLPADHVLFLLDQKMQPL